MAKVSNGIIELNQAIGRAKMFYMQRFPLRASFLEANEPVFCEKTKSLIKLVIHPCNEAPFKPNTRISDTNYPFNPITDFKRLVGVSAKDEPYFMGYNDVDKDINPETNVKIYNIYLHTVDDEYDIKVTVPLVVKEGYPTKWIFNVKKHLYIQVAFHEFGHMAKFPLSEIGTHNIKNDQSINSYILDELIPDWKSKTHNDIITFDPLL